VVVRNRVSDQFDRSVPDFWDRRYKSDKTPWDFHGLPDSHKDFLQISTPVTNGTVWIFNSKTPSLLPIAKKEARAEASFPPLLTRQQRLAFWTSPVALPSNHQHRNATA